MKVLFITRWYPTEENPVSGVFVREHAKAVSLTGHVAVLHGCESDKLKTLYEVSVESEGSIKIFRVKYRKLPMLLSHILYLYSMIRAFQKIREQFEPEIIHAHVYIAGFLSVIFGKLYDIPVVITEHAKIVEKPNSIKQRIINAAKILIARFALNNAQLLLPASKSLRRHLEDLGVQNDFRIIPNIVDTKTFYPIHCKKDTEIKKILFVGLLHPVKGIPYLLNALGELQKKREDFHLDIVGYGPYKDVYERMVVNLGLSDKVSFHGMKTKNEVAKFMQKCDFLVFPSLVLPDIQEGFGIVLIEALACGKPVITTSNCERGNMIVTEYGVLVPPEDFQSLLKAIEYMLDNFQRHPTQEVIKYVRKNFSYKAVGRLLHNHYIRAVEKFKANGK